MTQKVRSNVYLDTELKELAREIAYIGATGQ